MHHTERSTETQCASFITCSTNNLQRVGPWVVAVNGMAGRAAAPTSGDVNLLFHCSHWETANTWLGKVVDSRPAAGYWVECTNRAHGALSDTDSEHRMLRDLLCHATEDVEQVVDCDGEFASGSVSRDARHLCPGLRRDVKTLRDLCRRSVQLIAAKHVQLLIPGRYCRPADWIEHPPTRLKVIAASSISNKYRCLQTTGTKFKYISTKI